MFTSISHDIVDSVIMITARKPDLDERMGPRRKFQFASSLRTAVRRLTGVSLAPYSFTLLCGIGYFVV